jgi:hypothetical protein
MILPLLMKDLMYKGDRLSHLGWPEQARRGQRYQTTWTPLAITRLNCSPA